MGYLGYYNPVVNVKGTPGIITDVSANRTTGYEGLIYSETDTALLYQYVNGGWQLIGGGGGGSTIDLPFVPTPDSNNYSNPALEDVSLIGLFISGQLQQVGTYGFDAPTGTITLLNGQTFQFGQYGNVFYQ